MTARIDSRVTSDRGIVGWWMVLSCEICVKVAGKFVAANPDHPGCSRPRSLRSGGAHHPSRPQRDRRRARCGGMGEVYLAEDTKLNRDGAPNRASCTDW